MRWVHRYAIGGAALAALPVPLSHTAALVALETYLMNVVGGVYGDPPTAGTVAAAGGTFALGGQGLKLCALRATTFLPLWGIPIRVAIAGAAIEALGHAIVAHYERKHPGKRWGPGG
jgi:uncharacterized protein (DUF697 family)